MDVAAFRAEHRRDWEAFAREMERHVRPLLEARLNPAAAHELLDGTWQGFAGILDDLPFIGEDNPLTGNLAGAAYEMNLYRNLEAFGLAPGEISVMVQTALVDMVRAGMNAGTEAHMKNVVYAPETLRKQAERSQQRRYEGDWVLECVTPGPEDHWDVGVNYTECGIAKMFKKYGCERYMPFVCLNDYPMLQEMGITLERSRTIGNGAPLCDFRLTFTRGTTGVVTNPEMLREFANKDAWGRHEPPRGEKPDCQNFGDRS